MAKTRSPNYPQLDFGGALEKARIIYKSAHQHTISDDEIAEALGYVSLNGRSMGVISAIKKYGLLVPEGEGYKISEDAFNVFELPVESKEHFESLKKMAFTPQIFVEIRETYGEQLPSNQILRHYLIKNKFNPNVADEVVKNFHATIDLVTQAEESYNKNMKSTALSSEMMPPNYKVAPPQSAYRYNPIIEVGMDRGGSSDNVEISKELKFALSDESEVQLLFRGEITQTGVKKLIRLLEISFDLHEEPIKPPAQQSLPNMIEPSRRQFNFDEDEEPKRIADFSEDKPPMT
ncbi:MAG: hypothetical protein WA584_18360 [Pyrinomonadaceae bacterium]